MEEKLTSKDLRLLEIAVENLLEIYAEIGVPKGTELAVVELERLKKKINLINNK